MSVAPGSRLGPYEVVAQIGAGGMGEVWRGRDTRLDRSVAIKILPEGFAGNEMLLARFEREARTISSLSHPHICTVFDVGHESGSHYLVMELLEGESLADRLARGPLPIDHVIRYGAQIAEALDRAHEQGIVHRDLKPGNVMITKSGAKLLDFGLARAAESAPIRGLTEMPTQARPLTEEGTILGTFQYMAPEQLEGLPADARTDIFAFGALLYEMATGRRAFEGPSRTSLIAAIVSSQPAPISSVMPMTPPALDHIVRKCLEKNPEDRWHSAHDVATQLRWISEAGSQAGAPAAITNRRRTRENLAWGLAALMAIAAIVATGRLLTRRPPARTPVESAILSPPGWRMALVGGGGGVQISPDGQLAVFVMNEMQGGSTSLWIRPLGAAAFREIPGTEGARGPFWSPDSRKIGFFADGKLKTVDPEGGGLAAVCNAVGGGGASWGSTGTIVFTQDLHGPLAAVRASGGTPVPATKLRPGDTGHRFPKFLPDGKTLLFVAVNKMADKTALCQTTLDRPDEIRPVLATSSPVAWVEPGIILYSQDRRLRAQRYDAGRATTVGEPVTLSDLAVAFSASNDGKLLFQRNPNLILSQLVWVDRSGREEKVVAPPGLFFSPALSRDERRFAVDLSDSAGQGDIWVHDVARSAATRVTFDAGNESAPQWSPDGRTIVYHQGLPGEGNVFSISSGGTGQAALLTADPREKRPTDFSRDGKWIVFNSSAGPNIDIGIWSAEEKKARPWLATPFREQSGRLSPDGRWMAYQSDESGRWEIYVRGFPESDRKWLVSSGGGIMPMWRGDGRELYYVSLAHKMMAVPVTPGAELESGDPVPLFEAHLRAHPTTQYDVTADGRRFLLNRRVETSDVEPVVLLQNWDVALTGK